MYIVIQEKWREKFIKHYYPIFKFDDVYFDVYNMEAGGERGHT